MQPNKNNKSKKVLSICPATGTPLADMSSQAPCSLQPSIFSPSDGMHSL